MTEPLTITSVNIIGRSGPNLRPVSGYVSFSDGKDYHFGERMERSKEEEKYIMVGFRFGGYRKMHHGGWESFGFNSPKREALLAAHLEG